MRDEVAALRSRGHDVELSAFDSDELDTPAAKLQAGLHVVNSRAGIARAEKLISEFQPQVVLLENLFPQHSPAVVRVFAEAHIPMVAAVRNFRMQCAAGTFFRDGTECRDCVGSVANEPAIRHRCYGGSYLATAAMACSLRAHRTTWNLIDHFLPISGYMATYLESMGFAPGRMTVRHNYVEDPNPPTRPGDGFFYAGRLTEPKGFDLLVDAWARSGLGATSVLRVAGTGPSEEAARAAGPDSNIELLGLIPHEEVLSEMSRAAVTVVPSIWSEPFGRVATEAGALARAVVAVRSGGLVDIIDDPSTGWLCEPTADSLAHALVAASEQDEAQRRGHAARGRYLDMFTEKHSIDVLESVLKRFALVS